VATARSAEIDSKSRAYLAVQREVSRVFAPLSFAAIWFALRVLLGYRIDDLAATRRRHHAIHGRSNAPLLVCANHLTMIDSFLISWAMGSPLWFFLHFSALPWNVPERLNFATAAWQKALVYLLKCLPIERGGRRTEAAAVLARVAHLLRNGESVLIFPEGGRSRSGRVEEESAATGVGRVIRAVEGCRVLCIYLRGARQEAYSRIPARGDRFRVIMSEMEPKTDQNGLRGSRDLAQQVVRRLRDLEAEYFDGRQ